MRRDRVLLGVVVAVVALRVATFVVVARTPVMGDEAYYLDAARALSNLVRDLVGPGAVDGAELDRMVVGSGWFMPGMSVVLTPLFLVVPDAPVALVRGYLMLASTGLLLATAALVRRTFGRLPALGLLVMPGLVPVFALFGAAAYGDSAAGLLTVVVLCLAVRLVRRARAGAPVRVRDGVGLGLAAIADVYLRSSTSILVAAVLAATGLVALVLAHRADRLRVVVAIAAAGVAFLAVLLPWSYAASRALDDRVLTTTSVSTVMANTFGDREQVCFGPCDPGSTIWFSPLRYSREVARATGVGEVEAQREMSAWARRDVTPHSYARDVVANLGRYADSPSGFVHLLATPGTPAVVVGVLEVVSALLVFAGFAAAIVLLLAVVWRPVEAQVQSLLVKLAIGALLAQPFVHQGGSRYWTTLGPVLGLGVGLAAVHLLGRRHGSAPEPDGHRWLVVAQGMLVAGAVVVPVVVGALAL